jgi:uncharacterized phage protein (TIGR01671 family)
MQDRFKFRFWHKPTNKMLDCYGFNEHCTFANTLDGIGTEYNPCATKDCELMQCTGLKDKNGKLIYEGDIVSIDDGELKGIAQRHDKFDEYYGCIEIKLICKYTTIYKPTVFAESEVIGNLYENKELLEEYKDE